MNHDELMKKINDDYKETPIVATNGQLAKLCEALKHKGFNFHPSAIIKELDLIAEKQFKSIVGDLFTGMGPDKLVDVKNEIIQWYNDEEIRFAAFKENYLSNIAGPFPKSESAVEVDKEIVEETSVQVAGYDPGRNLPNVVDVHAGEVFDNKVTPIKSAKSSTKHGKAVKTK